MPAASDSLDGGKGGNWKDEELEARRALIGGGRGGGWKEEDDVRRPLLDVREEALMDERPSTAIIKRTLRSTKRNCSVWKKSMR